MDEKFAYSRGLQTHKTSYLFYKLSNLCCTDCEQRPQQYLRRD